MTSVMGAGVACKRWSSAFLILFPFLDTILFVFDHINASLFRSTVTIPHLNGVLSYLVTMKANSRDELFPSDQPCRDRRWKKRDGSRRVNNAVRLSQTSTHITAVKTKYCIKHVHLHRSCMEVAFLCYVSWRRHSEESLFVFHVRVNSVLALQLILQEDDFGC
jgi:hypothetical protein